ncbi:MAG: Uma2 family endonuclease [Pseudomonadota bacterium]
MSVAPVIPPSYRMTFADWLRFPDDGRLYEILGGELHVAPPPSILHQRVSRNLGVKLVHFLDQGHLGEALLAPIGVRFSDDDVLEPDLLVVLAEHAHRVREQFVEAPPDLVVEILSPGTAGRDLGAKRRLYEAATVPEYWIVDPESRAVEVLVLEGGRYRRFGLFRRKDTLRSQVLEGFELPLAEVFPADG